ncbi:2-keto-4-pentenoate hydratase [Streptomyces phaeochromogenes]|uniref:2-keto-4-pentenoate hydratase n=1 Tax=Streptomyces phaeochromogenes TaxID=1923 RepID=UPI002DDA8091|nr:fumarylacetoacetate hydrolase family protein [Streptomyces phaeochromogenes]WRZ34560.1 fumarylacetoacetate hydrolase family protein [Streptomyces phaeochromogenes]
MQRYDSAPNVVPDELAAVLRKAEADRSPVEPLTRLHPGLTVAEAYAVQDANTRARLASGERIVGRKIGLTSQAMQRQFGVDQPDFGVLFDSMVIADSGVIRTGELIAPRAEAEIAFVLGKRLYGPDVTADDARAAVSHTLLALEVIDSRIEDWKIELADTVADNASSARVVAGPATEATPELLRDLKDEYVEMSVDGQRVAAGAGAALLGDPLEPVAWLARTLYAYGVGIEAGELVMAGAVDAAVPLTPGSTLSVRSGRLPALTATVH